MLILIGFTLFPLYAFQPVDGSMYKSTETSMADSIMVRRIFDEALVNGQAYENLRDLCSIGHRLSGSENADNAVDWGVEVLEKLGFDTIYKQPIDVPWWERGNISEAKILGKDQAFLRILALGGSISTNGKLVAEVIEVDGIEGLKALPSGAVKGKIVFYNRPMDPRNIVTFQSYGGCVDQRYWGAVEAAKAGAVAVMVRSLTTLNDHHPHTGSMAYVDSVHKIPAVAVSTSDADRLHRLLSRDRPLSLSININPSTHADKASFNVIGEIKGSVDPEKIIIVGGHLDSWDVGDGAHDDGAGIVHSIEALRLLKSLGYQPRYTLRVVLFMNEENGNMGGKGYAAKARAWNENHIAAIESDRGGFTPRGFSVQGDSNQVAFLQSFRGLLEPYGLHIFEKGYGGVDINPLGEPKNKVNPNLMLLGFVPDSQRYFDFHHSETDVFENVNQRELELGCASIASLIYLLDQNL